MNVYVYTYIFDVMKIVYSILHAMRAIVCVAHERENTVLPYIMTFTLRILYDVIITKNSIIICPMLFGMTY